MSECSAADEERDAARRRETVDQNVFENRGANLATEDYAVDKGDFTDCGTFLWADCDSQRAALEHTTPKDQIVIKATAPPVVTIAETLILDDTTHGNTTNPGGRTYVASSSQFP